jgi:diguanylate cyclase (GGDEF)-like protein
MRKPQQSLEDGQVKSHIEINLRKQISNLRKKNLKLRKSIKISANKTISLPDKNSALNIEKINLARQDYKNQKLTEANSKLIMTSVEMQIALEEIKNAKAAMHHLAYHDFLTDLPNRMQLYEQIRSAIEWAKRHNTKMALMFLDIDRFKSINDSLGHATGDKLLQSIAKRLRSVVRSTDTVSRIGGDEFVLLFSEFDQIKTLIPKIEKIREVISLPHRIGEMNIDITTSMGISLYPDDGEDSDTLMLNADAAMYHAKETGRNRFYFFKPEMRQKISNRQNLEKDVHNAIRNHEFELFYQAQINLRNGTISGVEALIRWRDPIEGMLSPAYFIPACEECGAIVPLGRWILQEACQQAQAWVEDRLDFNVIAVNISAREFDSPEFLGHIGEVLQKTGLDPSRLELEITETVLMKNIQTSIVTLHKLREMGVKISIDDFGTGYSSLSYLMLIPFDTMKIDQSFISNIFVSHDDVLIKAIINIGKNLHRKVIAEGVETSEQLDFLRSNECEVAQGFYLHVPMPGLEFKQVLKLMTRT